MNPDTRHATEAIMAELRERFECWNTGELDEMASMYSPRAELDTTAAMPDGRVYVGKDAMRRVPIRSWGRAKLGEDGLVIRNQMFPDAESAIEAAR